MVAVDASCAVKWFVPEAGALQARELLVRQPVLVAPDILPLETANALLRKQRNGEAADGIAGLALRHMEALKLVLVPHATLLAEAVALSQRLRHPVYDCLYLVLASSRAMPLATFDQRLATLAQRHSIPLWSPEAP